MNLTLNPHSLMEQMRNMNIQPRYSRTVLSQPEFIQKRSLLLADLKKMRKSTSSLSLDFNIVPILNDLKFQAERSQELIQVYELRMRFQDLIRKIKSQVPDYKPQISFLIPSRYLEVEDWKEEFLKDQEEMKSATQG